MSSVPSLSGSRTAGSSTSRGGGEGSGGPNRRKSTVFHPVSMSTTARYDIVDHMNSHYRRINGAKATVDTTPPKSYLSRRSPSPGLDRTNSRASSATRYSDVETEGRQREAILRTSSRINFYLDALRLEQHRLLSQVASQNVPFRRSASNTAVDGGPSARKIRPPPDLIDRHSEDFTSSDRPFVPRLLRTTATSRLEEYRWYNSPRRRRRRTKRRESDDTGADETFEGSNDDRVSNGTRSEVVEATDREYGRVAIVMTSDEGSDRRSTRSYVVDHGSRSRLEDSRAPQSSKEAILRHSMDGRKSNGREVDDEGQYLQFVVDVTNDVLARGIYTNKVLKQVFRNHVERRSKELNVNQMEITLKKLREDLGISDDEEANSAEFGYGRRRKETTDDTRTRDVFKDEHHSRSIEGKKVDGGLEASNGGSPSSTRTKGRRRRESLVRNGSSEQGKHERGMDTVSSSVVSNATYDEDTRQRMEGLQLLDDDDDDDRFFEEDHF